MRKQQPWQYNVKQLLRKVLGCCRRAGVASVLCLGLLAGTALPAHAAALPKLDLIRVALFMETAAYSLPASEITLSAENGLYAGIRQASEIKPLFTASDQTTIHAALDAYSAIVWETTDAAQATALSQKFEGWNLHTTVVSRTRQGKPLYQLMLGSFATKEAAVAGLTKAAATPEVSAVSRGATGKIKGPLYWNAGVYAAQSQAQAQIAAVEQAGYDADLAYLVDAADAPQGYAVMVSSASDSTELNALKVQIHNALPAVNLQPVDKSESYVLKRTLLNATSTSGGAHIQLLLGGNTVKLAVTSNAAATIKVAERSERTYRGMLELSRFNGKLAVINELPFEQYLVSVVSSELSKEWPIEALKAQAVAARTYALKQGLKYKIAHVTDTTLDQAYKGAGAEFPAAADAVNATLGEVLADQAGLITPLYYSNAGGLTAESTEVWGNKVSYLKSTATPDDGAEKGKALWYQIVLPNGHNGYIHSSYVKDTGQKNPAELPYYEASATNIAVRPAPYVDNVGNPAAFKVNIGDRFVVIGQVVESNAFSWIRGPYDADKLKQRVNTVLKKPITGLLESLEITKRGPSGRVIEMKANGQLLETEYPDALRTLFNGLPSTRFEIEEAGRYTIVGADGVLRQQSASENKVAIAGANSQINEVSNSQLFVMNGDNKVRMTNKSATYVFKGTGFGHGLGMSQWGAKGYAELGFDYKKILQTYYDGVSIIKE